MTYKDCAFIVDFSYTTPRWDILKQHVDSVCFKIGGPIAEMPNVAEYIQEAYDHDIPAGVYWVFDPEYYPSREFTFEDFRDDIDHLTDPQVVALTRALKHKTFYYIWLDFEIGKRYDGSPISPTWVKDASKIFMDRVRKAFPNVPVIASYTAKWYVEGHSKVKGASMYDWLPNYPLAEAYWTRQGAAVTWDYRPPQAVKPTGLNNPDGPMFWQYAGDVSVDGMLLDFNITPKMTRDEFYKLIKFTPRGQQPDPDPGEPPVIVDPIPDDVTNAMIMAELQAVRADVSVIREFVDGIKGL